MPIARLLAVIAVVIAWNIADGVRADEPETLAGGPAEAARAPLADAPPPAASPVERLLRQAPGEPAADRGDEFADSAATLPRRYRRRLLRRDPVAEEWGRSILPRDDLFTPRQWSASYLTGYIGINLGPESVPFEMLPQLVRLNCMWNRPHPERFFKGTWEGIAELTCLPVTQGPATIVIGGSIMLRYYFGAWKNRRIMPYLQMGGGGMYTDEHYFGSPVLSSGFNFIVQDALGVNVRLGNRWSLNAEWAYYHFSNGGIALPNISVNQMGGLVGLTYYFGRQ